MPPDLPPYADPAGDAQPTLRHVTYLLGGAFHRLAFWSWGDPARPPVICVHGLTRQGRDFDALARALQPRYWVVCPDLPGRGRSDWLPDPALYVPANYAAALAHLLARIDREVSWVGTSLGGICGMLLAAAPGTPIRRMVLNDVGPHIPRAAIARIAGYVGGAPDFSDLPALEAYLRGAHASFGALSDAHWADMARHSARPAADGRVALHYDPALADAFRATPPADVAMWPVWDAIDVPMLTLRGEHSDLLLPDTLDRMAARSAVHVVAGAGHAPALGDAATIGVVKEFIEG